MSKLAAVLEECLIAEGVGGCSTGNLTDATENIAVALGQIGKAIMPLSAPGPSAVDGDKRVGCLVEAGIDIAHCLKAVADAIERIADAMEHANTIAERNSDDQG